MELNVFTFNRKGKAKGKYNALQFAKPNVVTLTRGSKKGQTVTKLDISEFVALDEATIRKMIASQGLDFRTCLILGANLGLRRKATGGGMQDVMVLKLRENKVIVLDNGKPVTDPERVEQGYRAMASAILSLFREKSKQGKNWSLDKCYAMVVE